MNVLPHAIATGCIHSGTMIGKLNGVMPATTPSGWRNVCESTPPETWSLNSPLSICGMPAANSTTSRPRTTSPLASSSVLPCSELMIAASSSSCSTSSWRKSNMTRERAVTDVSPHVSNAWAAAATAASTSPAVARRTWDWGAPTAGS